MKEDTTKRIFELKLGNSRSLEGDEMKEVYGSGNSQIRYIPDEYLQARILGQQTNVR